jgi:hypothetical protein
MMPRARRASSTTTQEIALDVIISAISSMGHRGSTVTTSVDTVALSFCSGILIVL